MVPGWNLLQVSFMPRQVVPAFVHKPTGNPPLAPALALTIATVMTRMTVMTQLYMYVSM